MKRYLYLLIFISLIVINLFSDTAIIFPTITIGFSDESYVDLSV